MELPRVLIVSSDAAKVAVLKKALHGHFQMIEAPSAIQALDLSLGTDFCIVDAAIHELPALNFCRQLSSIHEIHYPILLITSRLTKSFIADALNAGVTDFLNDPLNEKEIEQRMLIAIKSQDVQKKTASLASHLKQTSSGMGAALKERFLLGDLALKEISKIRQSPHPASLLVVEVDGLSAIRQEWGELAAEEVFASLTMLLHRHLRQFDQLFPQGAGKYTVLLPKTSLRAAFESAEMIRSDIDATSFSTKKGRVSITVSIGLISFNEQGGAEKSTYESFDNLLGQVNRALKKAQEMGNQIEEA
jgi:diguanylate cyclase (GGDEF)-like protein